MNAPSIPAPTSAAPSAEDINAALIAGGFASDQGFSTFIQELIGRDEAGFVDSATDPGGATRYGFSLRLARQLKVLPADPSFGIPEFSLDIDGDGDIDGNDIKRLPLSAAVRMYHQEFWQIQGFSGLVPYLRRKLANLAVVMGPIPAGMLLQRAVRACGGPVLVEDGRIGAKTLDAASQIDALKLMVALRSEAAGFFRSLTASNPALKSNLNGWLNRAYR